MLYFDTTYLYRVYSTERGHEAVKQLLSKTERLASAWHGRAEFASIVLRKRREGIDSSELLESLEIQFQSDIKSDVIKFLPLTESIMFRLEDTLRAAPPSALPTHSTSPAPPSMASPKFIRTTVTSSPPPRSLACVE